MAFVVAIAGMMLPAISKIDQYRAYAHTLGHLLRLMSNLVRVSMPNIIERRLALAATKSRVSSSSLSKVSTEELASAASCCP